jgi:hypothetical protein
MTSPQADAVLSLTHAMKMADNIRRHFKDGDAARKTDSSYSIPPGAVEGVAAFAFAGLALLPARRVILQQASGNPAFRHFMDLVVSVGHAIAATQVGLMAGSVYGGRYYLQEFAQHSPTTESPVADRICDTMWTTILPPHLHQSNSTSSNSVESTSSWDPRIQTMDSLQQAIENCRRRQEYKESNQ